ncbi:MAG: (deoxy)nucleoside triphosphate pyrophosphohydrolase [Jatrophihabitans sp.]|uniref:(deoxy)nucleoside triphosphate pyrophosphohydrolase n=1 Tax=Jatrophihabitans sp. TaxID=1932789 RepID=UPI00391424D4
MRVVAAAIVRDGQVLVARRSKPAALAGGWEFPGGKIEHGESDEEALVRECAEELGVRIAVGAHLGTASDQRIDLVLHAATLRDGEPVAGGDHDELSWSRPDELDAVAWLPIDRELVPAVAALLREPGG